MKERGREREREREIELVVGVDQRKWAIVSVICHAASEPMGLPII